MTDDGERSANDGWSGRIWIAIGMLLAGLAVVLGALGAHGFDRYFAEKYAASEFPPKSVAGFEVPASWKYLQDYRTAVRYQMWHALGLMVIGLLLGKAGASAALRWAAWSLLAGTLLFCGSLYTLTLGGPQWQGIRWGMVAPVGGTLLIVGWLLCVLGVLRSPAGTSKQGA